jgi:aquaglyceroporin related protein
MEAGKAEGQYDSTDGESSVVQDGSIQGRRNQTERGTALEDVPETSPNITPFHRSMTLPPRPRHAADDTTNNDRPTRHRGRTISSRPRNFDSIPLSEEAPSSGPRRRASTRAISPTNISNVRARLSSNSGRPQRRNTLARAPSFGAATGRSGSVVGGFSLAGLQDPIASQHQPYVDPGYAELNPAYEQPGNVRPVWGLAKPLPRVLRPGMVPSPSELHMSVATDESEVKHENDQADVELGKGTVDPAIPLGRISSQLQTSRRTRGHPIFRSFSSRASSNLYGRDIANEPGLLTPHNETSELQEDQNDGQRIDAAAKNSDYFGSSFANDTSSEQFPFPDITESEATEVDEKAEKDWPDEDGYTTTYDYQEEVHNHHTQWSEIRLRFREPLAEFLAVCQLSHSRRSSLTYAGNSSTNSRLLHESLNNHLEGN